MTDTLQPQSIFEHRRQALYTHARTHHLVNGALCTRDTPGVDIPTSCRKTPAIGVRTAQAAKLN